MHLSFLVMKERLERIEIEMMESVGVGVAKVEAAADEAGVVGVDIEAVIGNARGDGVAAAEAKFAAAVGVGVAKVEAAADEAGVVGVDIEAVIGNACCGRIRHLKFPYLGVYLGIDVEGCLPS